MITGLKSPTTKQNTGHAGEVIPLQNQNDVRVIQIRKHQK